MDSLLLTKRFAVIIEVKSIIGTLLFDRSFNQLIRTKGEKEEGFLDPFLQIENQRRHLTEFFQLHNLGAMPIEALTVISNPETIIKTDLNPKELSKKVLHAEFLPQKITLLKTKYNP